MVSQCHFLALEHGNRLKVIKKEIKGVELHNTHNTPGECAKAVEHALKVGYRHIDAAPLYGNEKVGEL